MLYEMCNLPISEDGGPPPRIGTHPLNAFCSLLHADLDDAFAQIKCDIDMLKCVQSLPSTSSTANRQHL